MIFKRGAIMNLIPIILILLNIVKVVILASLPNQPNTNAVSIHNESQMTQNSGDILAKHIGNIINLFEDIPSDKCPTVFYQYLKYHNSLDESSVNGNSKDPLKFSRPKIPLTIDLLKSDEASLKKTLDGIIHDMK